MALPPLKAALREESSKETRNPRVADQFYITVLTLPGPMTLSRTLDLSKPNILYLLLEDDVIQHPRFLLQGEKIIHTGFSWCARHPEPVTQGWGHDHGLQTTWCSTVSYMQDRLTGRAYWNGFLMKVWVFKSSKSILMEWLGSPSLFTGFFSTNSVTVCPAVNFLQLLVFCKTSSMKSACYVEIGTNLWVSTRVGSGQERYYWLLGLAWSSSWGASQTKTSTSTVSCGPHQYPRVSNGELYT